MYKTVLYIVEGQGVYDTHLKIFVGKTPTTVGCWLVRVWRDATG